MALSNAQYDLLMRAYDCAQLENLQEQRRRVQHALEVVPGLREVEEAVSDLSMERSRALLAGQAETAARLYRQLRALREEKAVLLADAGLPADYLNLRYQCSKCRDTGYIEGEKCSCFRQRIADFLFEQYPIREQLRRESFASFCFDYFDREPIGPGGLSSLENMQEIYQSCLSFCRDFVPGARNLLFSGPAGAGKTFLSNCIAGELMKNGFSVVYLPAGRLFERLADAAFRRSEDSRQEESGFLLESDLLIIDDLGTELTNSFVNSQLFYCLNERRLRQRSTLISTNLSLGQLRDAYSERVVSRLIETYECYNFFNSDIRLKKRMESAEHSPRDGKGEQS